MIVVYVIRIIIIYTCIFANTQTRTNTDIHPDCWPEFFSPARGAKVHSSVNLRVACLILFKHNDPILRIKYIKGDNCCSLFLCIKFNNMIVWPLQK